MPHSDCFHWLFGARAQIDGVKYGIKRTVVETPTSPSITTLIGYARTRTRRLQTQTIYSSRRPPPAPSTRSHLLAGSANSHPADANRADKFVCLCVVPHELSTYRTYIVCAIDVVWVCVCVAFVRFRYSVSVSVSESKGVFDRKPIKAFARNCRSSAAAARQQLTSTVVEVAGANTED